MTPKVENKVPDRITIENIDMMFRNFSGIEEKGFNPAGRRNFCAGLTEEWAEQLANWGFNVKRLKPREAGEPGKPYIKVNCRYKGKTQPRIVLLGKSGRTNLYEDTVTLLDSAEIQKADITFTPYFYDPEFKPNNCSAYLKTAYVTVIEDDLDAKYAGNNSFDDDELSYAEPDEAF